MFQFLEDLNKCFQEDKTIAKGFFATLTTGRNIFFFKDSIISECDKGLILDTEKSFEVMIRPTGPNTVSFGVSKLNKFITKPKVFYLSAAGIASIELIAEDDTIYSAIEEEKTGIKKVKPKIIM
jgi:hypothetical protein